MKVGLWVMLSLAIIYGVYLVEADNTSHQEVQTIKKQHLKILALKPSHKLINDINQQLESIEKQIKEIDEISKRMKGMVKNLKKYLATIKANDLNNKKESNLTNRLMAMYKELLALNNQMQMESRQFNAISNTLKVRHDTEMAVIRNIR